MKRGKKMKRILPMIIITQFLLVICISMIHAQESSGPRLVLKQNVFDAKEVKAGDIITHTFTVLNTGDSVLKIDKVKPG